MFIIIPTLCKQAEYKTGLWLHSFSQRSSHPADECQIWKTELVSPGSQGVLRKYCAVISWLKGFFRAMSQKHRRVEVGRDLWRSFFPTPLLEQCYLEPVAQDHYQMACEYVQGGTLHKLPGQDVPVLSHPQFLMRST